MKPYREIIVHAGLSKTGSTSIQHCCRSNREFLANSGICYPAFTDEGQEFDNHSLPLLLAISEHPGRYALGLRRRFGDRVPALIRHCRQQVDAILANPGADALLLSSERLAGLEPEDMDRLRDRLLASTDRLRVVIFVRNPEDALGSILQERVKAGAVVEPESIPGRIRRRCEDLENCFSDYLEAYAYEQMRGSPYGAVGAFFELAGIDPAALHIDAPEQNQRLSAESFAVLDAINRRLIRSDENSRVALAVDSPLRTQLMALPGQAFQIPGFDGSPLQAAARQEMSWLESRLGLVFPPVAHDAIAPPWQEPALEALAEAVAQMVSSGPSGLLADILMEQAAVLPASRAAVAEKLRAIAALTRGEGTGSAT